MNMNIQSMSKKLRNAADALDALVEVTGTPHIARKIAATLSGTQTKSGKVHWMHDPKNAARLKTWRRNMKRAAKARKAANT